VSRCVVYRTDTSVRLCHDMAVPKTVVIADDHPSFRASARAILESEGFEVIGEAEDGAGAIAAVRELAPDVLLLDVQLPDMDGFAVCRQCEVDGGLNGGAPVSVVLVSSRDACDYGGLIEQSGARGFIAKAELSGAALADLLG
jgi:DNA-binding NarL/FixJ family response regulator